MLPSEREACAALPAPLADAVIAAIVVHGYRPADALRLAAHLVKEGNRCPSSRALFDWLVQHLEARRAQRLATAVERPGRRLTLRRLGDSNVIRLGELGRQEVRAYTLAKEDIAGEVKKARAADLARLTRRPIGNDNEPVHHWPSWRDQHEDEEFGEVRAPALRIQMRMERAHDGSVDRIRKSPMPLRSEPARHELA